MNKIRLLLIFACVLLTACDNKFARLKFDSTVHESLESSKRTAQQQLAAQVANELSKLGIQTDEVNVVPHKSEPEILFLTLPKGTLSVEKRAAIKQYLRDIVQARQKPMSFSWQSTASNAEDIFGLLMVDKYGEGSAYVKSMRLSVDEPHWLPETEKPDTAPRCFVTAHLAGGFDPNTDSITINTDKAFVNDQPDNATINLQADSWKIAAPTQLGITNDHVVELIRSGQLQLHLQGSKERAYRHSNFGGRPRYFESVETPVIRSAYFMLPIQSLPQQPGSPQDAAAQREQCKVRFASFGRPFSFYTGVTIDRLESVTFMDEQTADFKLHAVHSAD